MVLITGGDGDGGTGLSSVEVFSPSGVPLSCTVPPLPSFRRYHTQDGLVACSGEGDTTGTRTTCIILTGGGWQESHQLQDDRLGHSSWRSPAGLLLMGGDYSRTSTEMLSATDSTTSSIFTLEYVTL